MQSVLRSLYSGIASLQFPLVTAAEVVAIDPVLPVLAFFLLPALLSLFAFLAAIAHTVSTLQCKRPFPKREVRKPVPGVEPAFDSP